MGQQAGDGLEGVADVLSATEVSGQDPSVRRFDGRNTYLAAKGRGD
ncbi:hypothetical protein [Streptomyces canus]